MSGERMSAHRNESAAQFIDQLEHLPELSPEELEKLSKQVREFSKKHLG
jgi:flagellar biosynthesis chaperone FliJ